MNEDQVHASRLIPISVLALDVDPPSVGGWTAYLAGRGTPAAPPGPYSSARSLWRGASPDLVLVLPLRTSYRRVRLPLGRRAARRTSATSTRLARFGHLICRVIWDAVAFVMRPAAMQAATSVRRPIRVPCGHDR
jgi:hypothetical protein